MLLKLINEKTEFRLADFMNCRRNNLSLADLVKVIIYINTILLFFYKNKVYKNV